MANSNEIKRNPDGSVDVSNLPDSFKKIPEHRLLKNKNTTMAAFGVKDKAPHSFRRVSFDPITGDKTYDDPNIKPEIVVDPTKELTATQVSLKDWMENNGILAWAISAVKVFPEKTFKKIFSLYLSVLEKQNDIDDATKEILYDFKGNIDRHLKSIENHLTTNGKKTPMERAIDHMRENVAVSNFFDRLDEMTDDEIRASMITLEDSIQARKEDGKLVPENSDQYPVLTEDQIYAESEEDSNWSGFFQELYQTSVEYSQPFKLLISSLEEDSAELKDKFDIVQELVYMEVDQKVQNKYNDIFKKVSDLTKEISEFNGFLARDLVKNEEDIK